MRRSDSVVPLTKGNPTAFPAASHRRPARGLERHCVGLVVWVAFWTVGFGAHVDSAKTPANVFKMGDRFQVLRVDATAHAAQMVQFKPFGDWSDMQFVGNLVSIAASPGDPYLSVPVAGGSTKPQPAPGVWFGRRESEQSFDDGCHQTSLHDSTLTGEN